MPSEKPYSEELTEPVPAGPAVEGDAATLEDSALMMAALAAERDHLAFEKSDLHDRVLRLQAEFDNFRRRSEREREEIYETAGMSVAKALLPIADDFERGLKVETQDKIYARGMELIYARMLEALKKAGVEPIDTAGQQFDPMLHEAIESVADSDAEDQAILGEFQRGYRFRGRLLRPAMVRVAVNSR